MNILALNKFYYLFGGSDRYYFDLNKLHKQAGHHVIPFAMQHPNNFATPYANFFVSQVNYWDDPSLSDKVKATGRVFYSSEANRKIRRLIEDSQPNIAHIHLIYHQISPSVVPVLKEYNIPIVQTLHDYKPICPTYSLVSNGKICERCYGGKFYNATLQRCNHNSLPASLVNTVEMYLHHALRWYDLPDMYIAPSNFMRNKMIEFGMQANKIVHIPNFVDTSQYRFSEKMDNYFIYLGRLHKIKGIRTLLLAMRRVRKSNTKLLLIGDGPQRMELEELAKEFKLTNVEFRGFQSGKNLSDLLENAMFNVLPSEVYENCPMSVLELMSMGKPTIGARIGGIPELIEDGVDGLLFESGNADDLAEKIDFMLSDPLVGRDMGRAARDKAVSKYNGHNHYEQVLDLYEKFVPSNN